MRKAERRLAEVLCVGLLLCATAACGSNLTGTSHTVILRPMAEKDRYYGAYSLIQATDWQNGRSRTSPLSRADIDPKTGALRFALPFPVGLSGTHGICLMIVGNGGPIPIRSGASGPQQYTFRNRLWEAELQRMAAVKQAEQEAQHLAAEERAARNAITQAERTVGAFDARAPEQCRESRTLPLPERPIDAVVETERGPLAAAVCAAAWEELLGPTASTYYQIVNRSEDWKNHAPQTARQKRMNYHIGPGPKEIHALRIAPEEGERWMLYEATVARFRALTGECETRVVHAFAEETARWEKEIQEIQATPRRELERCQRLTSTYRDAKNHLDGTETKLHHLVALVDRLRKSASTSIESESLLSSRCQ